LHKDEESATNFISSAEQSASFGFMGLLTGILGIAGHKPLIVISLHDILD
jgi:hypothetical protein